MIHNATAKRRRDGWHRWYAECVPPCPYWHWGKSREDAFLLADEHNEAENVLPDTRPFDCTCLYLAGTDTVEAADTYPCEMHRDKEATA